MGSLNSLPLGVRSMAVLASIALFASCSHHHLDQYTFADRSLGMVYLSSPAPVLETGWYNVRNIDSPLEAVVRAGSGVAKEIEGRKANARLDSASARINVAARLSDRTLERASRYLGTHPTTDQNAADFLLEIDMENFGIDVRGQSAAYLFIDAEAVLLDAKTGREIWSFNVHGYNRLTPFIRAGQTVPTGMITAGILSTVSVDDFQQVLEQLADFSADRIVNELRAGLRDVRQQ